MDQEDMSGNIIQDATILDFWNWFESSASELEKLPYENGAITTNEVSQRVKKLDESFVWEIGPCSNDQWQFVISPNGNFNKLKKCLDIVALSPNMEGWQFRACKPKKSWDMKIETFIDGRKIVLDFSLWTYFLVVFDGNKFFDINFVVPSELCRFGLDLPMYGGLFAEAELGERCMMEYVDRIDVLDSKNVANDIELTPVKHLYNHISSLVKS